MTTTRILLAAATAALPLAIGSAPTASAQPAAPAGQPVLSGSSVEDTIALRIAEEARASRQALVGEAMTAWEATTEAMTRLERPTPDADGALEKIREALGTVEVLLARDAGMGEVPVAVRTSRSDTNLRAEAIEERIEEAENALGEGQLQKARKLIGNLGSAVTITTVKVDLNTWPDRLRSAAAALDTGDAVQARARLQQALGATVSYEVVMPLPALRAEQALADASKLAQQAASLPDDAATEGVRERVNRMLDNAVDHLAAGEALSYYDEDAAEEVAEIIEDIRDRVEDGDAAVKEFAEARRKAANLG